VNIMGKGFFRDDLPVVGPYMVRTYYQLMGAKIGKNVSIHKDAKLGQADLLTIGDDVAIDNATVRPFAIEEVTQSIHSMKLLDSLLVGWWTTGTSTLHLFIVY
jgi:hypothetical protein